MPRVLAFLGLAVAGALAAGCAPALSPDACPAIGFISTVDVDVTAIPEAAWVQICQEAVCSPEPGTASRDGLTIGADADGGVWTFSFPSAPEFDALTVSVTDSTGALLVDVERPVEWTRSAERCGGPSTAPPIVLSL